MSEARQFRNVKEVILQHNNTGEREIFTKRKHLIEYSAYAELRADAEKQRKAIRVLQIALMDISPRYPGGASFLAEKALEKAKKILGEK